MSGEPEDKRVRGLATLEKLFGEVGKQVVAAFDDIAPDMGRYIVDHVFGDVYADPVLDLKTRQLANVAALTALGNAKPYLKTHVTGAINAGATPEEIVAVIMQMSVYAGVPAAMSALMATREVFEARGISIKTD